VVFDAGVLFVDIDFQWVAARRESRVKLWLVIVSFGSNSERCKCDARTPEDILMDIPVGCFEKEAPKEGREGVNRKQIPSVSHSTLVIEPPRKRTKNSCERLE